MMQMPIDMKPPCKPIPLSLLGRDQFAVWPVWSEYYDFEELSEIASWGVSTDQFLRDVESLNLTGEHAAYPVLDLSHIPDRMRIYLKASLKCADGKTFDGYIVNPDPDAFVLFVGDSTFIFNTGLSQLAQKELQRLAIQLNTSPDEIRPTEFATEFRRADGSLIAGPISLDCL